VAASAGGSVTSGAQNSPRALAEGAYGSGVARLASTGDVKGAYAEFSAAVRHDSTYGPAVFNAALLSHAAGDSSASRRLWIQFLRIDSTSVFAGRARRHLDAGRSSQISTAYDSLMVRARWAIDRGDRQAAAEALEQAYAQIPDRWEAPALLARVLLARGATQDAVSAMTVAWTLAPDSLKAGLRGILAEMQKTRSTGRVPFSNDEILQPGQRR
jgi:tetratricopeptide (TPR) repeat protein